MLTSSYPLPGDPTWGPFIRDHARAVQRRGHDVTILTPSLHRGLRTYRDPGGHRVVAFPYAPGTPPMLHCDRGLVPSMRRSLLARLQLPGFLLASVYYLIIYARRTRPDLVHAHWLVPGGLSAALAKPVLRLPLVCHGHGADLHLPDRPLLRRVLGAVHRHSDATIVASRYLLGRAEGYGLPAEEIDVAPYGVDTETFTPSGRRASGQLRVGLARRLVPEKRVGDLLEAVAGIPRPLRDGLTIRIAGDGPERPSLERVAHDRGLSDRTAFLGPIPHGEMPRFLDDIDVLVNPSIQEGLSTGSLEALASGVPVIACRGVGNVEAIEEGRTGWLYPPRDVPALRESILRALESRGKMDRMRRDARKDAVRRFSLERAAEDWERVYRRVVAGTGRLQ